MHIHKWESVTGSEYHKRCSKCTKFWKPTLFSILLDTIKIWREYIKEYGYDTVMPGDVLGSFVISFRLWQGHRKV